MTLLNPGRIAQEEGITTLLTIDWNMLTRPVLRQRILSMRETFIRHGSDLGYCGLTLSLRLLFSRWLACFQRLILQLELWQQRSLTLPAAAS